MRLDRVAFFSGDNQGGETMSELQRVVENLAITDSTTLVLHAEKDGGSSQFGLRLSRCIAP